MSSCPESIEISSTPPPARPDLKDLSLAQLTSFAEGLGLSPFRARQIFAWLYRPGISSFAQMTDLSKELRERLAAIASFSRLAPETIETSRDGTRKYAFRLDDGAVIESVLIPEDNRRTLCISSQVGCAMGCRFCLTGTMGFKRNLRPAEIVGQVVAVLDDIRQRHPGETAEPTERLINNLVFMGMGEPLLNFDNLIIALDILMDQRGLNFSSRRITVSTCGIVPRIVELGERAGVNLAISLHAVSDEVRDRLMPINRTYDLEALLAATRAFPLAKRRRVMFEYILIRDLNDSDEDARALARKLHGIRCKINLLPYNENPALPFRPPAPERIEAFQQILRQAGFTVLVRTSRGADISAACGQLAANSRSPESR